jgi:ATP-dependent Clp protease protease subunit
MLKRRVLFITGEVNDESAKVLTQQLLWLQADDPDAPVTIYINSGGGLVHSGIAIVDVMLSASMPIKTVGYGRCFSIAAVLLAAGTPGHRSAFENARLMVHEPSCSYTKLQVTDLSIKVEELRHNAHVLAHILAQRTGKSEEELSASFARDHFMSAAEGKEFGLIDYIRAPASKGSTSETTEGKAAAATIPEAPGQGLDAPVRPGV